MNLSISTQTQMTVIAGAVILVIGLVIFLVRAERNTKRKYSKN